MVYKCVVYGCKSGYATDKTDRSVAFHAFPREQHLRDKWTRAIARKDFEPTKHSRVCSLHFQPSDFIEERRDTNKNRLKLTPKALQRRNLKPGAVPSVIPNAPVYLSKSPAVPRPSHKTTAHSRRDAEARKLQELEESFVGDDNVADLPLSDIMDKLKSEETSLPPGFVMNITNDTLLITLLEVSDNIPQIVASIVVQSDLTVVCSVDSKLVPASYYSDLVTPGAGVTQMSQLCNLMARLKSWHTQPSSRPLSLDVDTAAALLQSALRRMADTDSDEHRKLSFIVEQLQLVLIAKHGRHYSPQLTVFSYLLHASSSAAYNVLLNENILCLPSTSTLKKVTRRLHASTTTDNSAYLKLRVSKLNAYEQNVLLIIDEIYVAKRVECSGGEVIGLTADGNVASTLLCFMIKSLVSKYKDIVAICPMDKLTAQKLYDCYADVMTMLRSTGVNVVAISVDNAATNRKFFVDCLCQGTLKTHVIDEFTGQPIFLIFDPVHAIKNVYNNFQSRKFFECPAMAQNLPDGCCADFSHIKDLYNTECSMALRKAHRLTAATLQPKSIEKTSVKLAVSVFSESTRDALLFYANNEGRSAWAATAAFISLILKLWNVLNVKTATKGKHKREISMDPIRSALDWKVQFLREFGDFLQEWEKSEKAGLSKETFLALRHTCHALADCACFLLDRLAFQYVLLGHIQSDAIESRFGWLRQLSGANYYISMRQVVESDKKIRALSLLKFSHFSLVEIDEVMGGQNVAQSSSSVDVDRLADSMAAVISCSHWPSSNDANIIYYVSGAIARSASRSSKCDSCRETLVSADALEPLELDESLDYSAATFLNSINRGGLVRPADYTFMLCVHCWRVFEDIRATAELRAKFLASSSQRMLFAKIVDRVTTSQLNGQELLGENFCFRGHDLKDLIVHRFFNCVAKNLAKDLTNSAGSATHKSNRGKIAKLQSATHA